MNVFKAYAAFLVLAVTNIFVFAGIAWNRSGEPTGVIIFDQCELNSFTGWSDKKLRYLSLSSVSQEVSGDTLTNLYGVDLKSDNDVKWFRRHLYVVLQHGGPEWKSYLKDREQGVNNNLYFSSSASKLIIVDGNVAPERLQETFSNTDGRAILPGYITEGYRGVRGVIRPYHWNIVSDRIAIDSQYRAIVNEIRDARIDLESDVRIKMGQDYINPPCTPTHRIIVKWGQRFEPWISSIEAIKN